MSGSVGNLREQIARIEVKLDNTLERALESREEVRKAQGEAERQRDSMWAEMRNIKHESRADAFNLSLRIEKQEKVISELSEMIRAMKLPVEASAKFQRQIGVVGVVMVTIGTILWSIRDAIWELVQFIYRALAKA